jgi:hypothetical protein
LSNVIVICVEIRGVHGQARHCYVFRTLIPRVSFLLVYEPELVSVQIMLAYNITWKQLFFDIFMIRRVKFEMLMLQIIVNARQWTRKI